MNNLAYVWDAAAWKVERLLFHDVPIVQAAAFQPGGGLLLTATGGGANKAFLWDLATGKRLAFLEGHEGKFAAAAFSAGGKQLATVFQDRTARVWRIPSGELVATVRSRGCDFLSAAFADGGSTLHTVAADGRRSAWPLDALPVALARKPRDLTPLEVNRLELWGPAEREEYARRQRLADLAAERSVSERTWNRDPADPGLRDQYFHLLSQQVSLASVDPLLEKTGVPVEICRLAVEKSGERDEAWLARLSSCHALAGAMSDALLALEKASRLNVLKDYGPQLLAYRQRLLPDLPSLASVDEALADLDRVAIVPGEATWRFFRGKREPSEGLAWTALDFDDSAWESGPSPFGHGTGPVGTTLEDMKGTCTTLYIRRRFTLVDPGRWEGFTINVKADNGCIVYVNGAEVARLRVRTDKERLPFDGVSLVTWEPAELTQAIRLDPRRFRAGDNVLALQGLNAPADAADFLLAAEVSGESFPDPGKDARLLSAFRKVAGGKEAAARRLYLEGRLLQRRRRFEEAAATYARHIELDRSSALPRCRRVECLRAAGRAGEAEEVLRAMIREAPEVPDDQLVELHRAATWVALWPHRGLEEYFRAYLWTRRDNAVTQDRHARALAAAQHRLGLNAEALSTLEAAEVARPSLREHSIHLAVRALASHGLGKEEEARAKLEALREALKLERSNGYTGAYTMMLEAGWLLEAKSATRKPP